MKQRDGIAEIIKLIAPIGANIDLTNDALERISSLYESRFLLQQQQLETLTKKVHDLEERLAYQEHASSLHDRKIDDLEQVSRKVNLRLKGLPISNEDSPVKIMDTIQTEIAKLELNVPVEELDRCYRDGKPYTCNGVHQ